MLGPIDYIVVSFKGNNFDGSIISELIKAVENKIIRVVDLLFIIKDSEGNVLAGEFEDQSEDIKAAFGDFTQDKTIPLFSEEDLIEVGNLMENNTAAGVLVLEQLWALGLKKALINAGGSLIAEGRVHPEVVSEILEDIKVESKE